MATFRINSLLATGTGSNSDVVAASHLDAAKKWANGVWGAQIAGKMSFSDSGQVFEGWRHIRKEYKGQCNELRVKQIK